MALSFEISLILLRDYSYTWRQVLSAFRTSLASIVSLFNKRQWV